MKTSNSVINCDNEVYVDFDSVDEKIKRFINGDTNYIPLEFNVDECVSDMLLNSIDERWCNCEI